MLSCAAANANAAANHGSSHTNNNNNNKNPLLYPKLTVDMVESLGANVDRNDKQPIDLSTTAMATATPATSSAAAAATAATTALMMTTMMQMPLRRRTISVNSGAPSTQGAPSETQSEISSADSDWSDIRAIAVKLGVANPDDLHTERFKVDRMKLEQMLQAAAPIEGVNGAEYFFENAMNLTATYISWPCRLKIGAKNKKDPHVRIVGRIEEVQRAKEHILASLDSRGSRVIMKMDVSYTDHSYIIGRGGNNIKRIMEDTQTHIHFPDSNRANATEKSNQVSLCGTLEGIERARAAVRLSTPILYSFELPVLAAGRAQPDRDTPYVKMVETKYNVQVIFSSRPKLHSALVLVKGSEKEAAHVQEATQVLINCSCDNVASQISVQMQMEISPQHHEIVKGKNNTNLLSIMDRTRTKIIFPDLNDMNVKQLKKSQVTITGTIDGVYKARQQLLGNLPIALIFDFPDNNNDASEIMNLSTKYGVFITLRQKQRQSTLAIVIKGVEKFIDKIYEARHDILRLATPLIKAEIPKTYFAPNDKNLNLGQLTALSTLLAKSPDSPKTPNLTHAQIAHFLQQQQQIGSAACNNNNNMAMFKQQQQQQQQQQSFLSGFNGGTSPSQHQLPSLQHTQTSASVCPPTQKYLQMHNNFNHFQPGQSVAGIGVGGGCGAVPSPPTAPPPKIQQPQHTQISPRNSLSHNTSGYQSYNSSTTSLEQACPPGFGPTAAAAAAAATNRIHYSPDSTYNSDVGGGSLYGRTGRRSSDGVLLGLGASGPIGNLMPGCAESFRNLHYDLKQNRAFDFDMKRVMGFKAMERAPISGELRTPTPNWSGLALSRTSPAPLESSTTAAAANDEQDWQRGGAHGPASPYNLGVTTGVIDSTPTNRRLQLSHHKDIHSLFTSLGLEHYIKIFVLNEIDLEMFITLTEGDLMELGITAFGARKKMLVAINSLQANEASCATMPTSSNQVLSPRFSGSAAPGAERRPSNQW